MKNIWWNQVTNAVNFVNEIKQSLLEEKSILLKYSNVMPWREQFEDSIQEAVKLQNAEKKFVKIPKIEEPGEYLLSEFCKKEKRAEYRPSKGYARFFAESNDIVLHDRYIWVQVSDAINLEKWMTFVSAYVQERRKEKKAVFILEWSEGNQTTKKGIKEFSFDNYLGEYDRIVFAVLASSSIKEHIFIKNYLVELVNNVVGNDIELCSECIREYRKFLEDPIGFIKITIDNKHRSDGSTFRYEKLSADVDHLIWLAQIKAVYPQLEEYREDFIQKHSSAIAKCLPIQASYGETYTDPKDVELGTLMYMAGNGFLPLSTAEHEKLKRNKEARNSLSHLSTLRFDEIEKLI